MKDGRTEADYRHWWDYSAKEADRVVTHCFHPENRRSSEALELWIRTFTEEYESRVFNPT